MLLKNLKGISRVKEKERMSGINIRLKINEFEGTAIETETQKKNESFNTFLPD